VGAKKPTIYIETTVPNYIFSEQYPEKQRAAREVFELIRTGAIKPSVSRAVVDELTATPDKTQRAELLRLLKGIEVLPITEEAEALAQKYLDERIFPKKKRLDAQHVAVASVNKLDFIISWNFEHIVRVKTRELVEAVSTLLGYQTPEIVVPEEVIYDANHY